MSAAPTDILSTQLAQRIFSPLAVLRRRCRLYLALEGLVPCYLALLAAVAAQLLFDRGFKLAIDQRGVLSAAITVFWLWMLSRHLLRRLLLPLSDRRLAATVDQAHPELHDQLATAVQFARGEIGAAEANSPALVRAVMADACEAAPRVHFLDVLNHRRARQRAGELGGFLLATVVGVTFMPDLAATWFQRNWLLRETSWPQQTRIAPIGFDGGFRRMPRGDELEIAAENTGRVPKSAELRWWLDSGSDGREPMKRVGDSRWEVALGVLTEDVHFRIVGGDEYTQEYVVVAVDRPRVLSTTVRITPPAYTGLDAVTLEQQTVLEVLAASRMEIEATLNRPVASARFVGAGGDAAPCVQPAPDCVHVTWDKPISGSYAFELLDRDGWSNRRPVRYTIKVVPDAPPNVQLELPSVGESITPTAELPARLTIDDNYGLGGVALRVQRGDEPAFDVPLEGFAAGRREFLVETFIAISTFHATPGDHLRVRAEASDLDPSGPNIGRAGPIELRVITPTDFLAELAARELELRREFERLLSAQRGLTDGLERLLPELAGADSPPPALAERFASLARRQDSHAATCLQLRQRFAQILDEMRINKVARSGDERRIGQHIITPLEKLGTSAMPSASARINELRGGAGADLAETLPAAQGEILRQMEAILANMLEWESYREVVVLLQEIIDIQAAVHAATVDNLEQQLDQILGLEEPTEP